MIQTIAYDRYLRLIKDIATFHRLRSIVGEKPGEALPGEKTAHHSLQRRYRGLTDPDAVRKRSKFWLLRIDRSAR
jgi:hypothetical protein